MPNRLKRRRQGWCAPMKPSFMLPDTLGSSPRSVLLGYPRGNETPYLDEMRRIGVDGVALFGGAEVNGQRVLGKGHTGVVILVRVRGGEAALKMRRSDSPRPDMVGEAALLAAANRAGVGPRLLGHTPNLLLMEYMGGTPLREWLAARPPARAAKAAIRRILEQCYGLDRIGLDHGELTDMSRHALVGTSTAIIDFESASLSRRPANVTSAAQCLYLGGLSAHTRRLYPAPEPDAAIDALRTYKSRPGPESFGGLLDVLGV